MRMAIVCDWLVTYAGAERVLGEMLRIFPDADLFAVVDFLPDGQRGFLQGKPVKTTFIQNLPWARKRFRNYLPLMPLAIEQLDLSGYEVILSSSHAVAKGVITGPDQLHISYVHTPMRYAWDMQGEYFKNIDFSKMKQWFAKALLHYLRIWDARTANGVDHFIANSHYIARRIQKCYRREAEVIYPPVDIDAFAFSDQKEAYYLTASRLVPYKKVSLIAETFRAMPDKKLVIIGDGPEADKVKHLSGGNIEYLGYQPFEVLREKMQHAKAFVFAAEEDFGIAPVEAQACGTSVIAYGKGGVTEIVRGLDEENPTGVFFSEQTAEAVRQAVLDFEQNRHRISPRECRKNAERFAAEKFRDAISAYVEDKLKTHAYRY